MISQLFSKYVVKVVFLSVFLTMQLFSINSYASIITKHVSLDGKQEVGTPGDLDGTANGTISFNDITGEISWNIKYFDIADPVAFHIHGPNGGVGKNAPILVGLGVDTLGDKGTLINSLVAGVEKVQLILSKQAEFYLNIHTKEFPAGAIRGQVAVVQEVPIPATFLLLVLGLLSLGAMQYKKSSDKKRAS